MTGGTSLLPFLALLFLVVATVSSAPIIEDESIEAVKENKEELDVAPENQPKDEKDKSLNEEEDQVLTPEVDVNDEKDNSLDEEDDEVLAPEGAVRDEKDKSLDEEEDQVLAPEGDVRDKNYNLLDEEDDQTLTPEDDINDEKENSLDEEDDEVLAPEGAVRDEKDNSLDEEDDQDVEDNQLMDVKDNNMNKATKDGNARIYRHALWWNKPIEGTTGSTGIDGHWKLQKSNVCFGAKGNNFGKFSLTRGGRLTGMMIVKKQGHLNCYANYPYRSNFGCNTPKVKYYDPRHVGVFVTDNLNAVVFPRIIAPRKAAYYGFYILPGYSANSNDLAWHDLSAPMEAKAGQPMRLWYGEDLINKHEKNNEGHLCVDVYARFE